MKEKLLILALALVIVVIQDQTVHAQRQRVPGYVSKPTISPYVNLFRANNGGLNSYFSYVRPQLEIDRFVRQSRTEGAYLEALTRQQTLQLQQSIAEGLVQMRPTSGLAVRSRAASFMNYSTYYPQRQAATSGRSLGRRR